MTISWMGVNLGAIMVASNDRPRVLIVHDDTALRRVLQDLCSEGGWNADAADPSPEAVTVAVQRRPQLVLYGVNHNQANWLSLIRNIVTVCPTTPLVAMMSELSEEIIIAVELAGGIAVGVDPRSLAQIDFLLNHYRPAGPGAARHAERFANSRGDDRVVEHKRNLPPNLTAR